MLDRVARLPGAPVYLPEAPDFLPCKGSCRAISANRGEINRENMAARGEFFRSYHLPVLSAEQKDSQSEAGAGQQTPEIFVSGSSNKK